MVSHDEYYKSRDACPRCGNTGIERTCMGYIPTLNKDGVKGYDDGFADRNIAKCRCGWRGTVHDLVAESVAQ